ncbi:TPA: DNA polymerase IV [Candidatus Acetothermia bacterium]|nr:DNA polymerase IV [Candidatus Acetothermia bacterium]
MLILHVDMDSYFASVEQQANPHLRGRPIVVSGRPDIHSVVAAASKEAKRYKIRSGMTTRDAQKLCPQVVFVPGDPDKYETVTRRFVEILTRYTPQVEVYSIDEVFLDVSQEAPRWGGPLALAQRIQADFREELGEWITSSIGIAPNKMLAKLAVERAKPGGVAWIVPEEVPAVLTETLVDAVCGIGPRITQRLASMGIRTLADLGRFPAGRLKHAFGVYGTVLSLWGQGLDPNPLLPYWQEEEVKSVGHSHAIPRVLRHPDGARSVLLYLCDRTARRLRAKGLVGRVIHYGLRDIRMRCTGAQRALEVPTDNEETIFRMALDLIADRGGFPAETTLVGVRVCDLGRKLETPRPLFPGDRRRERLAAALDQIRDRYGERAVGRGSVYACRILTEATGGMGRQKEIALAHKHAEVLAYRRGAENAERIG